MNFGHQYSSTRTCCIPEKNSGKTQVETAGYIPANQKIENMILAGQRLVDFRKSQFDFEDHKSIDEDFYDPTRSKNYDMADASQARIAIAHKYKNVQKTAAADKTAADTNAAASNDAADAAVKSD